MTTRQDTQTTTLPAAERLRATSTQALLRTFAALTHRLHAARANLTTPARITAYQDLRAQRDLVEAEVLRRTGDAP